MNSEYRFPVARGWKPLFRDDFESHWAAPPGGRALSPSPVRTLQTRIGPRGGLGAGAAMGAPPTMTL